MNNEFYMAVKSTIDKLGSDMAAALSAAPVDLDDIDTTSDVLAGTTSVVLWQLLTVEETPKDPLYEVTFVVGAKTSRDPGSYQLIQFNATLNQTVFKGAEVAVYDYSGASQGALEGKLFVTAVELAPQQFDEHAGIRLMAITCKALRI